MHPDFYEWLGSRSSNQGRNTRFSHAQRVQEYYGDLWEHFRNGTYEAEIITALQYSKDDEREGKPNPSKIPLGENVDIYKNLASYRHAARKYYEFLTEISGEVGQLETIEADIQNIENDDIEPSPMIAEAMRQKFSIERDMQTALRSNITSLDHSLEIIDNGRERSVGSGYIDITCRDDKGLVVIELKAGKSDNRAIGQILGYMGDLHQETGEKVRGILIAHEFDKRTMAAASVVPTLALKRYSIEFKFLSVDG